MVSRSQVRRAGERLRRDEPPTEADRQIYADYRDTFAEPLREVAETIGSFADGAPVQSRLKRFETVVEKLRRSTSDLSRLEDIAGCRVILPTMVEQHQTRNRIRASWDIVRERDYQTTPRDGYRALHIVVRAKDRPVEVQVRTEMEDLWANASEALANRLDPEIKYGGGPPDVRDLLDSMSRVCEVADSAEAVRHALLAVGTGQLADRLSAPRSMTDATKALFQAMARMDRDVQSGELALNVTDGESQVIDEALATLRGDDQ